MSISDERKHFVTGEDGYVVWWPQELNGAVSSAELRTLADELDRRNKDWDEKVKRDLRNEV